MENTGRYRVLQRVGVGSFASVWLGHDDELDVDVAIKVLADNWSTNADVRQRFLTEARMLRRIRSPRIVQVHDIGTLEDGRPFFVMDYADAGSLKDLRHQQVPPAEALRLCADAARALQVLHEHQILHRDVTPGNLLLTSTADAPAVLLADLGVAKSMVGEIGLTMTAGTPAYMAPEQATGIGVLDHRADVYSLAAVTHAVLTGHPPFGVRSLSQAIGRDLRQAPEPIAARLRVPLELDELLAAGLSAQPGRRPTTAAEFAGALDAIGNQLAGASQTRVEPRRSPAGATVVRPLGPAGPLSPAGSPITTAGWANTTPNRDNQTWETPPDFSHAQFATYPLMPQASGWEGPATPSGHQSWPPSAPPAPTDRQAHWTIVFAVSVIIVLTVLVLLLIFG